MISIDSNLQVTQCNIFGRQLVWKSANLHKQQKYIHLQEMWGFFFRGGTNLQIEILSSPKNLSPK